MSERLDRIEAILESSAQRQVAIDATLDRVSEQQTRNAAGQAKNKDDIETLLGAVSANLTACRELRAAGAASDARIDRLTERAEVNDLRFEAVLAEARADRAETRQLWNDAVTQMERDRTEARAQAEASRAENGQRFDAQMEVIQRLLIELIEMNRDNRRLRDRMDDLDQAG